MSTTITLSRNGDYWQAQWRDLTGKHRCKGLGRRKEAGGEITERAALKLCRELEAEMMVKPGLANQRSRQYHLGEWIEKYIDAKKAKGVALATLGEIDQAKRLLCGHFGEGRFLDLIDRAQAREWHTALANGRLQAFLKDQRKSPEKLAENTVRKHVRTVKAIFELACDDEILLSNPFAKLESAVLKLDKDWDYVSIETLKRLQEACTPHMVRPANPKAETGGRLFLGLCRLAGLRQQEALAVEWPHVDWDSRSLTAQNFKTAKRTGRKTRLVPIVPELFEQLKAAYMTAEEDRVCVGIPRTSSMLCKWYRRLCKIAGLTPGKDWCHTLRKNRQSDWISEGFPLAIVSEWMGHSEQIGVDHYLKVNASDFKKAAGVKEEVVSDAKKLPFDVAKLTIEERQELLKALQQQSVGV